MLPHDPSPHLSALTLCRKLELPWASRPEDSWPGGPDSFVVLSVFPRRARPGTEYNRSAGFMHASVKVFSHGFHTQSEATAYAPADCVTALRSGVQRRVEYKPFLIQSTTRSDHQESVILDREKGLFWSSRKMRTARLRPALVRSPFLWLLRGERQSTRLSAGRLSCGSTPRSPKAGLWLGGASPRSPDLLCRHRS